MMFCCCSCSQKVTVKATSGKTCGTLTISGELKNSGSVKIAGKVCFIDGATYNFGSGVTYNYTRSGSNVTLTAAKLNTSVRKIIGTYDSSRNTFTIKTIYTC